MRVEKKADGWRLLVDDQPFIIKGVNYTPFKVGESPDNGTLRDWMVIDDDGDGRIDCAYQSWVDKNRNNQQDPDEPVVGDFQLLKEMGANTIRIFHHPSGDPAIIALHPNNLDLNHTPNKKLLRALYNDYGIRVIMGDFLGAYTIGSAAEWKAGTDYTNAEQRANMLKSVEAMVNEFKDEPYILLWTLGNANNDAAAARTNAAAQPAAYAEFVNTAAKRIHELDGNHPVALVNGDLDQLAVYAQHAPDIDILGINTTRYAPGFGRLWEDAAQIYDKPVLITSYGMPTMIFENGQLDEIYQYQVHVAGWRDIAGHAAGNILPGNAIGGVAFEWLDAWWRDFMPNQQNPGKNGWHAEWQGIAAQGDGRHSPFLRQLRHVYYAYQALWTDQ
ncbi:MAG: hypothetical protein K8I00_04975 [Candidatus Omnitrophica bacterium]|nr:hypothetical protein [Candidatus Omnitrophota bacterium]